MADSAVFGFVADAIEQATALDRLESRGTVRLALKQAGLEAANVTPSQMEVVLRKVLPAQLESRGERNAARTCEEVAGRMASASLETATGEAPDAVFARLGGS